MKKIYILCFCLILSCTKEVDSPALLNQIDALKSQVSTLQSQVAEGSNLQNQLNAKTNELETALANYNASQASLTDSLAAYSVLEDAYEDLSTAYDEILTTVSIWFELTQGVYQFYTVENGVRTGADYVWDLGVTFADGDIYGTPYFDEYYGNGGTCYTLSKGSSLGQDSEVYIEQASGDDFGIIAYDLDASNISIFDINLYLNTVNQRLVISRVTGGIYFKIYWYTPDWDLIGTIGNITNPLPNPPLTSAQINALIVCN